MLYINSIKKINKILLIIVFLINLIFLFLIFYKSFYLNNWITWYIKSNLIALNLSYIFYLFYEKIIFLFKNKQLLINNLINKYLIYLLLILFFLFINYITFTKYINFWTNWFDLWIFSQVIRKLSIFETPSSSIRMINNILWDHFQPILYLYAIFYKLIPSPLILLFLQNLFFVIWWYWIYKISILKLEKPLIWIIFTFFYLFFIWNINAILFDFHPDVLAISLFPWLFYFSFKNKTIYFYLLVFFILLSKENLSIYISFFWIYQLITKKNKLYWSLTFFIGLIYFYLVMNYFIPFMWWNNLSYWSYNQIWANPMELIINSFKNPLNVLKVLFINNQKIIAYFHYISSWWIFIFSSASILLIPSFAFKFLSTREEFWWFNFHYAIDTYSVILISIICFFSYLKDKTVKNYKYIFIILIFIFINFCLTNIYQANIFKNLYIKNRINIKEAIKLIWDKSSISAQNTIVSHLTNRQEIYIYPIINNSDYIILNKNALQNQFWPLENKQDYEKILNKLINKEQWKYFLDKPIFRNKIILTNKYNLIYNKNWVLLFRKI